jgi:hypothetical protein
MNMNSNIKYGTSINGGVVLTDMPIKALVALRDAVDDAIRNSRKNDSDRLLTDIISAIDAANDEGYMVNLNGVPLNPDHLSVDYDEDEDYWDDDEDEDDEDNWDDDDWRECDDDEDDEDDDWDEDEAFPCYHCEYPSCANCPHK